MKTYKGHKIEKRTDGRYQARFYMSKKQYSVYGKTQEECIKNLKNILKNKTLLLPKTLTFYEYCNEFINVYKKPNMKALTLKTVLSVFKHHIKPNIPNCDMNKLTPLIINKALTNVNGRMKEYASQYLRELFKQAYKDKVIKIDIYECITKYNHKREQGVALTKEQRETLIKECKNIENGNVILFYLYTGCRLSEAFRITKEDIKETQISIPGTKTELSNRVIPIFKPLKPIINELMKNDGDKIINISPKTIVRRVEELRKKCNFHLRIKDLRTTFGTMLAEAGINDSVIAKWMGHTNTNTTKKYYIKILSEFEYQNANKFDTYFDT